MLVIAIISTLSAIGLARFGYTMILPSMQKDLDLTNAQAGDIATGNFIGYLVFALVGGFLATRFSHRRVIVIGLLLVGISMVLTATSSGFISAVFWRTLTGMGSGCSNVPMMGLLSAWFSPKRRGFATGVAVMGSSLGLIVTGSLVPILLDTFGADGWRYAWGFLGGIVLIIALVTFIFLRDHPADKKTVPIGSNEDPTHRNNSRDADCSESLSLLKSWSLVYKSGVVWGLALIYVAFGFSYVIYVTFFAKYLEGEVGYSKEAAGRLWQIVGIISLFCGVIWGWISDTIGRSRALGVVCLIQGGAYLMFALWDVPTGIILSAVLFGLTAWGIPAIMASACGDEFGPRLAPATLGFVTLFLGIGQVLGPAVAGRISDFAGGSFVPAFIVAAAAAWLGAIGSLFLKHRPANAE